MLTSVSPFISSRHKNGPKIPEEKNYQAEEFSSGVQHLSLPVTLSFHHQHVRHIL